MRTSDGAWNPLIPYMATVLACPSCGAQELLPAADHTVCGACGATWQDPEAVLDMAPGHVPRRRALWAPPPSGEDGWERGGLSRARLSLGPVDEEVIKGWVATWFKATGQGPVIDLQAGYGWMSRQLARWFGVARVLALDEDLRVLRAARESPKDPGMAWLRVDPRRLPFGSGKVAGAVVVNDPWLLATDPRAVGELARVVGVGGRMVGLVRTRDDGLASVWAGMQTALGKTAPPAEGTVRQSWLEAGWEVLAWTRLGGLALVAASRRAES